MIIRIRKTAAAALLLTLLALPVLWLCRPEANGRLLTGASVFEAALCPVCAAGPEQTGLKSVQADLKQARFSRPSQQPALENPFSYEQFSADAAAAAAQIHTPRDAVLAYYGLLRDASNMLGYSGACGTVGYAGAPYPYAYALLTEPARAQLPFEEFVRSFAGVGHITLLKLLPAYTPPEEEPDRCELMAELELITGQNGEKDGSFFSYYYGLVTVRNTAQGWRVEKIRLLPEGFLCAPSHGWSHSARAVVEIVYKENLGLVSQIDKTERDGPLICITASGKGETYRFEFVRLTNGYDLLLREWKQSGQTWEEVDLLPEPWNKLKLTAAGGHFAQE